MEIQSFCSYPSGYLIWQMRPGAWVLTLVCKATMVLLRGESVIAPIQEPLAEEDVYAGGSLVGPRDLVPVKPRAEILLVGHAYAPDRRPARSLMARFALGDIDKVIGVSADRVMRHDGTIAEGAPFDRMPLVYERAAGGAETWNPVGVRRDMRDLQGQTKLPNLHKASDPLSWEPVGFGPLAPTWRRASRGPFSYAALLAEPLGDAMDLGFFNVAPPDQQLAAIPPRPSLTLECLHGDSSRLTTELPLPLLHVAFEGRPAGPVPIPLRPDTILINTDSATCTVTFRGLMPLDGARETGRIVISEEKPPRPQRASTPSEPAAPKGGRPVPSPATEAFRVSSLSRRGPVLPFAGGSSPLPNHSLAPVGVPPAAPPRDSAPEPIPTSPWASAPERRVSTPAPQPLVAPLMAAAPLGLGGVGAGLLASSNAAAGVPEGSAVERPPAPPVAEVRAPLPAPRPAVVETLDLVWFDPASLPRLRRHPSFQALIAELDHRPLDPESEDPALADDPKAIEDRREVFEVLARGVPEPVEALSDRLGQGVRDDGKFVPPLVLVASEIDFPFDEVAALRATVATVTPLMATDEVLRSTVATAQEFLGIPMLMSAPAVAEALTRRIEDAFAQGKRVVPPDYLEVQRERVLLEQRQYQQRAVFGKKHLRSLLVSESASAAKGAGKAPGASRQGLPTYLPSAVAELLPMYTRFRARIVAEVHSTVDRYESHPVALRVLALARTLPIAKA